MEIEKRQRVLRKRRGSGTLVASKAMRPVHRAIEHAASDDIPVLLVGETGVGKEWLARRLHELSPRCEGPFVPVHCAAISESLFEAELFGHERGAFTGADQARPGLLETASGGTLFVDELGELPSFAQVKLLRVLEDHRVRRVGGCEETRIDVRVVGATNLDLEREVAEGRFRRDLYFRLAGFVVRIPPLRDRPEEILPLAQSFLAALRPDVLLDDAFVEAIQRYAWPGNVRELKSVVRRALLVSDGQTLRAGDLPGEEMRARISMMQRVVPTVRGERERILEALERNGGNQTAAARELGMSRRTLIDRLERYGIRRPRKR